MKLTTKKWIGGVVVGALGGGLVVYIIMANFIINNF
jgi:hypothetical protein